MTAATLDAITLVRPDRLRSIVPTELLPIYDDQLAQQLAELPPVIDQQTKIGLAHSYALSAIRTKFDDPLRLDGPRTLTTAGEDVSSEYEAVRWQVQNDARAILAHDNAVQAAADIMTDQRRREIVSRQNATAHTCPICHTFDTNVVDGWPPIARGRVIDTRLIDGARFNGCARCVDTANDIIRERDMAAVVYQGQTRRAVVAALLTDEAIK